MGGLGNQLFQIFAAIAYAIEHKQTVVFLALDRLGNGVNVTQRHTYWGTFLTALRPFLVNSYDDAIKKHKCVAPIMHNEHRFSYEEILPYNPNYLIILNGYFQSPRYFSAYAETIVRMLNFKSQRQSMISRFMSHNALEGVGWGQQTISLHIRLGDYKKVQSYHPLMSIKYYIESIQTIYNKLHTPTRTQPFTVICFYEENDADAETVANMITHLRETFFETNVVIRMAPSSRIMTDWEQMLLMSCCAHHIIANSSFSWWAAYLSTILGTYSPASPLLSASGSPSKREQKIICYPGVWFGAANQKADTTDLFPANWTKIE